jgi:hypothetical protein
VGNELRLVLHDAGMTLAPGLAAARFVTERKWMVEGPARR